MFSNSVHEYRLKSCGRRLLIATALLGLGSFYSEGAIALEPAPQDLSTSSNTHPTTTYPEASSTSDTERAEFIPFFEVKPALTAVKPSKVVKVLERDRLSALQTLRIPSYASTTTTTNLTNQPPQPTALGSPWSTGEDLTAAQTAERLTDAAAITMADASSISPTPSAMPSELSQAETTEEVPWRFVLEPYIYLPLETNGDVTIRNTEVPFDFSLGDILESLTFAFYGRFEAWKGPWAVVLDGYYFDTVESESRNIPAAALPPGLLPPQITQVPIDATAETAFLKLDLAGAYRFGDANLPDALSTAKTDFDLGPFVFDAIAGLRLYSFSNNIELSTPFGFERDFGRSVTFVEPMIGGRARWNFADDLAAIAAANLSGFGIGTDISVESYAGIDWLFSGNTSLTANYRLTYIDYTEGDSGLNFLQHGPAFGVKFRF